MVFATDGGIFERALIHPDRNNFAPRFGFAYSPGTRWVLRGGYGVFYTHTVRQGREGLLGFNPPFLVDNLLQTGVTGRSGRGVRRAVSAGQRLSVGPARSELAGADRRAPRSGSQPTHAIHPAVQLRHPVRADAGRGAGCRLCRQQGHQTERLSQPESASGDHQSERHAVCGARPYPAFGDIQWMENRVNSSYNSLQVRLDKRFSDGLTGHGQLHVGQGSERCRRITFRRAAAVLASTPAHSASLRIPTTCAPSAGRRSSMCSTASSRVMFMSCPSDAAALRRTTGTGPWTWRSAGGRSRESTSSRAAWR